MNGREVIRRLQEAGFEVARIRGSHHIMKKEGVRPFPVPVHGNRDLPIGTLRSIERLSGVRLRD